MKSICTKVKNLLIVNKIYLLSVFLFVVKALLLHFTLNINLSKSVIGIYCLIPAILMIPCLCKSTTKSVIYANFMYFTVTLLIYCNYIYYIFSSSFLSVYQLANLEYVKEIGMGLSVFVTLKNFLIFWTDNIIIILMSCIYIKKKKVFVSNTSERKFKIRYAFIVLLIIATYKCFSYAGEKYNEIVYNKTYLIENVSLYYYHVADLKTFINDKFSKTEVDYDNLSKSYASNLKNKSMKNEYDGIAKGSNLIILQLESMHEYVINKKINGKEITPNLNKFFDENIYCTNMYNASLTTTADSEHSIATSMYPLENGMVFQKYFHNNWYSLYSDLKQNGYYTSFMHPNINTYWNRFEIYNNSYKFNEYNDINSFFDTGERAAGFFSDEQFFLQAADKLAEYNKPFVSLLVGTTGHVSYTLETINNLEDKIFIDVSNIEDETFADYLKSMNFVDYSFGLFLEKLEKAGLLDNTVLVVVGDHGAGLIWDSVVFDLYEQNNVEYNEYIQSVENAHIPFGMKVPGLSHIKIENAVSKIDIKPTLESLLGTKDKFSLGENIFSNKDYAFVKGIGFITSRAYYTNGRYVDRLFNQVIEETEELKSLNEKMYSDIHLSDTIIKKNLLNYFVD